MRLELHPICNTRMEIIESEQLSWSALMVIGVLATPSRRESIH